MSEWQPIDTAPKNGEYILAIVAGKNVQNGKPFYPIIVRWELYQNCWQDMRGLDLFEHEWSPTHWMPLPEPPEA